MQLSLNEFLFAVITLAVVVAVTFLVLLLIRLRKTAKEGEETLVEIRSLVRSLNETSQKVQNKIDAADDTLQTAKKTAAQLMEIMWFLTTRIVRPSSKYWPLAFP